MVNATVYEARCPVENAELASATVAAAKVDFDYDEQVDHCEREDFSLSQDFSGVDFSLGQDFSEADFAAEVTGKRPAAVYQSQRMNLVRPFVEVGNAFHVSCLAKVEAETDFDSIRVLCSKIEIPMKVVN